MKLKNYVGGRWIEGRGEGAPLYDPSTGEELARASADGVDFAAALDHARSVGGANLRRMSFADRAALLAKLSDTLVAHRDKYFAIAQSNSGNTNIDATIDVDGGSGTLRYYAAIGKGLGGAQVLRDGGFERFAKDDTFQAIHLRVPLEGVAVHINAYNFPSWGLWEKVAVALLAGVPALAKPATATALLAHAMVEDVVAANVLPDGALSLVCGNGAALLDHLDRRDAIAFTGSAQTAAKLRSHPNVIRNSIRFNAEADSLNSSVLGPEASAGSPDFELFVREVHREMTVKAGQKCTAIRRALVPAALADAVSEALSARLAKTVAGNPRNETVTMGPLVDKTQQQNVLDGIEALKREAKTVSGNRDFRPIDADPARGAFVPPTLLRHDDPDGARAVHEIEVFGPVATLLPYRDPAHAWTLAARGGGSLVASVFTADDRFAAEAVRGLGASHGRVMLIDNAVGKLQTGHGIVMPSCVHGGPGRAGGGEELGGLRGLRFYQQRIAVQGNKSRLTSLAADAAEIAV
jgi:3,4-dehydroadipyl-CoA semialdehyde dehydrogenase